MIEEIDRLDQLVLDMLELSHLESGSQPMEMAPFSLNQLLDRCERQFSEPFRNSHIGLRLVAPGDECTVWGDMGSIEHKAVCQDALTIFQYLSDSRGHVVKPQPGRDTANVLKNPLHAFQQALLVLRRERLRYSVVKAGE